MFERQNLVAGIAEDGVIETTTPSIRSFQPMRMSKEDQPTSNRAVGQLFPPGPVEPDKSSLWMYLFSLDSVILIIVICNCLPFHLRGLFFGDIFHDKC